MSDWWSLGGVPDNALSRANAAKQRCAQARGYVQQARELVQWMTAHREQLDNPAQLRGTLDSLRRECRAAELAAVELLDAIEELF